MKKLYPEIWVVIVKIYNHAYDGAYLLDGYLRDSRNYEYPFHEEDYLFKLLERLELSKKSKKRFKALRTTVHKLKSSELLEQVKINQKIDYLKTFLGELPFNDAMLIVKDALEDEKIKGTEHDNWNWRGDNIREWRPQVIEGLKKSQITFDEITGEFREAGSKLHIKKSISKNEFISSKFDDIFYKKLKEEINKSYKFGIYTGTFMLCRKLIENLVIDVLRLKYPAISSDNLSLYYQKEYSRYNDFTHLLKNLEDKKQEFGADKHIIERFISLSKPFRCKANSKTHSIIMIGDKKELRDLKIETMVELLLKLENNLRNDLKPRS